MWMQWMQRTLFPMRAFLAVDVTTCRLTAAVRTKVGKLMMLVQNPARWLPDTGLAFALLACHRVWTLQPYWQ
jgi:hypothetical protein